MGWIGIQFDGVLRLDKSLGECPDQYKFQRWVPIRNNVLRVLRWLKNGIDVRILDGRADDPEFRNLVTAWCLEQFGRSLPITREIDDQMVEWWSVKSVQLHPNSSHRADGKVSCRAPRPKRYDKAWIDWDVVSFLLAVDKGYVDRDWMDPEIRRKGEAFMTRLRSGRERWLDKFPHLKANEMVMGSAEEEESGDEEA